MGPLNTAGAIPHFAVNMVAETNAELRGSAPRNQFQRATCLEGHLEGQA